MNSLEISEPLPVSIQNSRDTVISNEGKPSDTGEPAISNTSQGVVGSTTSEAMNNSIEEQAAIKAQAAFRGYLVISCYNISISIFYILVKNYAGYLAIWHATSTKFLFQRNQSASILC